MNCTHCRRLLDGWMDGEVDAGTAVAVEAHFARCVDCMAVRSEREALRLLVRAAREPDRAPAEVVSRLRRTLEPREAVPSVPRPLQPRFTWAQAMALCGATAAVAVAFVLAVLNPWAAPVVPLDALVDRHVASLSAGPASGMPALQFAASERHQLKPWFQGRVPLSPPVIDLSAQGFELLGGRVERIGSRDVAVVAYRIRKHPIEVYAWRDKGPDAAPHASMRGGFSIVQWQAGGLALAAVSDLNAAELRQFVDLLVERK